MRKFVSLPTLQPAVMLLLKKQPHLGTPKPTTMRKFVSLPTPQPAVMLLLNKQPHSLYTRTHNNEFRAVNME